MIIRILYILDKNYNGTYPIELLRLSYLHFIKLKNVYNFLILYPV